jgi:hypothetical protein
MEPTADGPVRRTTLYLGVLTTSEASIFISDTTGCYFYRSNVPHHFYDIMQLPKLHMIRTTCFTVLVRITALIFIIGVLVVAIVSIQDTQAAAIGGMTGGNSSQGIANTTIGAGSNITGSLSLRNMLTKTPGSEVHLSLANASTIAEKTVGPNSHAISVRIGAVHGFVVYIALVSEINHGIHNVLVDAGNGKVLRSAQLSIAPMMMRHG